MATSRKLTRLEMQIMETLWSKGSASIREIQEAFPEEDRPGLVIANTGFSAKEVEIIRLICRQMTAREISKEVYLSERTVEQYRSNITRRIGARNVAGVIRFALQHGIITLEDL